MDVGNGIEYLSNKTILITGSTGFLAKILVEKILRVQPDVKKLYLLIRAKDAASALDRLHNEVLNKDLFKVLREVHGPNFDSFILEKVAPIAGDTSLLDLGLNNSDLCMEIDAIIHVAASTKFHERYDLALSINTFGAKNILNFAKMCPRLQILIHVSTAYICGEGKGKIKETPCEMGKTLSGLSKLDIDEEKRLIDKTSKDLTTKEASTKEFRDTMICLGQQRATMHGWPNTYVFTKAMGEMLITEHRGDLPVVILRPTMVCSTYKDPFPGWVESYGSAATVSIMYGKGFVNFLHADGNSVFDLIPADMVVNSIITAMIANSNKPNLAIYHVGSSLRNPVTFKEIADTNYHYFNKNPYIDAEGLSVKIKRGKTIKNRVVFLMHLVVLFFMFLVLKLVESVTCHYFKLNPDNLARQLKATYKAAEMFRPYVFFAGIFDDTNTEQLRGSMSKHGISEEAFNFDPKCINWEDYLLNAHIPATVKYLF